MTTKPKPCLAQTKSGTPCKLNARPGSDYCHIHQPRRAAAPRPQTATSNELKFNELLADLDRLAARLRRLEPDYTPPPISAQGLVKLLKKFLPASRLELLRELQNSFRGTTVKDFLDVDTWKGLWYVVNYMLESESTAFKEKVRRRLEAMPGGNILLDLQDNLEGVSPRDLLDGDARRKKQ
ncbi:MAG: hypothetical protein ACE5G8_00015 [Anaerolineae bacterium]